MKQVRLNREAPFPKVVMPDGTVLQKLEWTEFVGMVPGMKGVKMHLEFREIVLDEEIPFLPENIKLEVPVVEEPVMETPVVEEEPEVPAYSSEASLDDLIFEESKKSKKRKSKKIDEEVPLLPFEGETDVV